jgi:sortase A
MNVRRWIGVLLILCGLSSLGYIGWQFWGTDWQSARIQKHVLSDTEQAWSHGTDPKVKWGNVEGIVRIPAFGKHYAIPLLEFTGYDALHAGFGHMPKSAKLGAVGNSVIIAHRTTRNEPLRHMPDLEVGDKVVIETRTQVFTYRLVTAGDALRVRFTAGWVMDKIPHNPVAGGVEPPQKDGQRLLTMITCAELFHSDDRLAAFGELDSVKQKPAP